MTSSKKPKGTPAFLLVASGGQSDSFPHHFRSMARILPLKNLKTAYECIIEKKDTKKLTSASLTHTTFTCGSLLAHFYPALSRRVYYIFPNVIGFSNEYAPSKIKQGPVGLDIPDNSRAH